MNRLVFVNILRFLGLVVLQVFILQGLNFGGNSILGYFHIIIYPLFILLLPHDIPNWALILLGFLIGITIDLFYNSIGVHAAASVLTATLRPIILKMQEPNGGYTSGQSPTRYRLGTGPFIRYTSILYGIHLIWYFSMELFTIAYIDQILVRSIISFFISMPLVILYSFLLNPKN